MLAYRHCNVTFFNTNMCIWTYTILMCCCQMGINCRATQSNRHTARISTAMWINRRWRILYSEIWRHRMWQNVSPGPYHYSLEAQPSFRQLNEGSTLFRNVCELMHGASSQTTIFCISHRVEYVKLHVEFTVCIEFRILNSKVFHFSRVAFLSYKSFTTLLKNVVQNTIKLRTFLFGETGDNFYFYS